MAVSTEILHAWRAPRAALRRQLGGGENEGRALIYLVVACLLFFIAQWPHLSRAAFEDPSIPLQARLGGALFGWMFVAPLFFYFVAAISHIFARLLGGGGTWFTARLALFWSLLAVSPAVLLLGLVAGIIGPGPAQSATGLLFVAAFLYIWISSLIEAERKPPRAANREAA
jgi:hypothetical protein